MSFVYFFLMLLTALGVQQQINAIFDPRDTRTIVLDTFETLTTCTVTVAQDFAGTWTALAALGACNATPIKSGGNITSPGSYCLANDIVSTITISANNVTLNLNNHTINGNGGNGINITGRNVKIHNGTITNCTSCVRNGVATRNIYLNDLVLSHCSFGLSFSNVTGLFANNLIIEFAQSLGITLATCFYVSVSNTIITNSPSGIASTGLSFGTFNNVNLSNNGNSLALSNAFAATSANCLLVNNCSVQNWTGQSGFFFISGANIVANNCLVQDMVPGNPANALVGIEFASGTRNCILKNTSVINVRAQNDVVGISFFSTNGILQNCLVRDIFGNTFGVFGFQVQLGTTINVLNCQSYNIRTSGALGAVDCYLISSGSVVLNCEGAFSRNGFVIEGTPILIQNCGAYYNSNNGFSNLATVIAGGCFATENFTNYVGFPNTQAASTSAGVFAYGNNFI